jgi:hypothetical protein
MKSISLTRPYQLDCIDFSDRLNKRKKAMYRTFVRRPNLETPDYEVLPRDVVLQETPVQKLRRLIFEVQELGREAESHGKVNAQDNEQRHTQVEHWYNLVPESIGTCQ